MVSNQNPHKVYYEGDVHLPRRLGNAHQILNVYIDLSGWDGSFDPNERDIYSYSLDFNDMSCKRQRVVCTGVRSNGMKTLLDEVMMFAGNEKEGHQLHDESFSPNVLCLRCLEANMYSLYRREAVKLSFKRELSDEFFMKSDHHLVELILNKLILNACRFTEHGEVLVGCNTREYADRITFFVEDTGGGIPENRLNNLFTWFDNPEDMNDEVELDLAVCQRVAQKLGGMLVRDEHYQRQGTRMLLVLPLK